MFMAYKLYKSENPDNIVELFICPSRVTIWSNTWTTIRKKSSNNVKNLHVNSVN
jgi:hypothetical protein